MESMKNMFQHIKYFNPSLQLKKIKIQAQVLYCIIKVVKQKLHEKR